MDNTDLHKSRRPTKIVEASGDIFIAILNQLPEGQIPRVRRFSRTFDLRFRRSQNLVAQTFEGNLTKFPEYLLIIF